MRHFPFRWVLPIVQLVVCIVALWPIRAELAGDLLFAFTANVIRPAANPGKNVRQSEQELEQSQHGTFKVYVHAEPAGYDELRERRELWPTALDLPAIFVTLPYVIFGSEHTEWSPRGVLTTNWTSLSDPFIGVLFWWVAGRGIEALVASPAMIIAPRIRWVEAVVGVLTAGAGTMAVLAEILGEETDRYALALLVAGGVLWFLLGLASIAAWTLQYRFRRKISAAANREDNPD